MCIFFEVKLSARKFCVVVLGHVVAIADFVDKSKPVS